MSLFSRFLRRRDPAPGILHPALPPAQPLAEAWSELEKLEQSPAGDPAAALRPKIERLLKICWARYSVVKQGAAGYPNTSIRADVWMEGAELGVLGQRLTLWLRRTGHTDLELQASAVWAQAVLAVQGHYRNLVGPAMLAVGDCYLRLGQKPQALATWEAVIKDFRGLVESDADPADERPAVDSLIAALQSRLHHDASYTGDLPDLFKKAQQVAERFPAARNDPPPAPEPRPPAAS